MSRESGFPVAREPLRRYRAGDLAGPDGTVDLSRAPVARRLAARIAPPAPVGELHALGLLHDVFHRLIERYETERRPSAFRDGAAAVRQSRGEARATRVLHAFAERFPVADRAPADATLEELLLTWLMNVNPAAEPLRELFDDRPIAAATDYPDTVAALEAFFERQPGFGPDDQPLVALLRAPALAHPTSLAGQLRFIRERWGTLVGDLLDRILVALDVIAEEERALHLRFGGGGAHGGFGGTVETPEFGGLDAEPERFSWDSEWMPRIVLMAKSTYVWLDQLSRRHERDIRTLDGIPDEELDRLARSGVTGLWLIGLWERSKASERIKRLRGNPDAVASAYSLDDYRIAEDLGGDAALDNLRARAWARGIRLASDMVPNHMGIDSRWVVEHPDRFISLPEPPYPAYGFGGPDLSSDERVGIFLEDHYYDSSDAAVVFRRLDRWTGENRFIYHGNDGTSFPWNDTAQLDYLKPDVREAVIQTILEVARRFPVIRFDAAMVLAKKHVERLWYPEPGAGGAIPSRAEHGAMPKAEFDRRMPAEFWREVVDRVAAEVPDTLLLAEAFWLLEGYFVRTLGMHRVYNSAFMHMLRDEDNAGYRRLMKETLEFDPEILKRYVNFMSNPDEKTALEQFGKGDKYFGVASVLATMPGLPMLGHGQIEGFGEKYGMEFRRATLDEQPDPWLMERHERELFPILHRRGRFADVADFVLYDFAAENGAIDENVYAYSNGRGGDRSLVVYHNRFASTAGRVRDSVASAVKEADGSKRLVRRTLADGLGLPDDRSAFVSFRDARTGLEYLRSVGELRDDGLFVRLEAYQGHVFWEFREVADPAGVWDRLAGLLGGRGVPSLEGALRELELEPVFAALRAALAPGADQTTVTAFVRAVGEATGTAPDDRAEAIASTVVARRRAIDVPAEDGWRRGIVSTWALLEPLGMLAPGAMTGPTSRAWFDELRVGPTVAADLRDHGLDEGAAWAAVERIRLFLAIARPSNVGGRSAADRAARVAVAWLDDPGTRAFLRVNRWEGVEWFDGPAWGELVEWTTLLGAVERGADAAVAADATKVSNVLTRAADASGYRVDRLREALRRPAVSRAAPASPRDRSSGSRPTPRPPARRRDEA